MPKLIGTQKSIKFYSIHFILAMAGDNLATNSLLAFAKGFTALHYCRICRLHNKAAWKAFLENVSSLRNVDNYELDLKTNDFQLTGIHERYILNKLISSHATYTDVFDIMHDLFEGVFKNNMSPIILHFINKGYFTLKIAF